jgi:hypothetical protein
VTNPGRLASLREIPIGRWAPGSTNLWIEIEPRTVTGRLIKRHRLGGEPLEPRLRPD